MPRAQGGTRGERVTRKEPRPVFLLAVVGTSSGASICYLAGPLTTTDWGDIPFARAGVGCKQKNLPQEGASQLGGGEVDLGYG